MSHLLPTALKESRCILHIDLDCFYSQVEQVRLGIPFDTPAAVQQWRGLIAVNYAARKAGIARHSDIAEAKRLCPDIKLLHVATYGPNDKKAQYHENPDRNTHKVCLDPYRNASREIFKIFHQYCDTIQKIGTDEGFMDVTNTVNQRLMDRYPTQCIDRVNEETCGVDIDWKGIVLTNKEEDEKGELDPPTWQDLQLAMGAELANEIRTHVYDKLHYTCSAGIAHYKVIAKLCSSKNKPNKQTVLRDSARMDFMCDVPFQKIRNLGGKLGSEVGADLEIQNSNELWKYSKSDLKSKYGPSTGLYLYHICRGIDHEPVTPSKPPQSIMAAKAFTPAIDLPSQMENWFSILSVELHSRILQNHKDHGTWPKSISIRYAPMFGNYRTKAMGTLHKDDMQTCDLLMKKFQQTYNALPGAYPCRGLDLVASGFSVSESSSRSLTSFFSKAPVEPRAKSPPRKEKETDLRWQCDKCQERVHVRDIDEHTDYHFALEISQQEDSTPKRKPTEMASIFAKRQK
ncbi:uncharacterized protein EV154DRAFT_501589 [Mucor mucedo]|uniref:uncharacterized protein n=1 Tax=Mucor mucedo TaxID=29922 RepID=UPI002220C9C2|nr:uncharacterized protein EV154DRAFT_501589 [Mucor mucedo]KAI7893560.1 hypothetical protein EV154DRAFT_501589 [Mucor mucedo]